MLENGMTEAECFDLHDVYTLKLDPTEKARIEKLEIFDEFEEWELLQSHYCICLGKRIKDAERAAQIKI